MFLFSVRELCSCVVQRYWKCTATRKRCTLTVNYLYWLLVQCRPCLCVGWLIKHTESCSEVYEFVKWHCNMLQQLCKSADEIR